MVWKRSISRSNNLNETFNNTPLFSLFQQEVNDLNAKMLAKVLAVVVVLTGLVQGIGLAVKGVNIADVPEILIPWWNYIVLVVTSVPWIALGGFGYNVFLYLWRYFQSNGSETYDFNKFAATLTYYIGAITPIITFAAMLPEPWNQILTAAGSAVVVLLRLIISEVSHLG